MQYCDSFRNNISSATVGSVYIKKMVEIHSVSEVWSNFGKIFEMSSSQKPPLLQIWIIDKAIFGLEFFLVSIPSNTKYVSLKNISALQLCSMDC